MVRVLFVCLGNICRSPMAEAVFAHRVRQAGLEPHIVADSAGTGHWHLGEPPHPGTRRMLATNRILYDHRARLVTHADLHEFDYVLAMDEANLRDVQEMGPSKAKVALLLDYAPHLDAREVPDPYYTGEYAQVYALVQEATAGLLAALREEHGL